MNSSTVNFCVLFVVALFAVGLWVCPGASMAQDELPYNNNIMGTLADSRVLEELELLDEQLEKIRESQAEFSRVRKELDRELKGELAEALDQDKRALHEYYRREGETRRLEIVAGIKSELLPEQIERLEQLTARRKLREDSRNGGGLLGRSMLQYLEIAPEQEKQIREKNKELLKRVGEDIRKLLDEARLELLEELDAEQKQRYEKLVGKPIAQGESEKEESNNPEWSDGR